MIALVGLALAAPGEPVDAAALEPAGSELVLLARGTRHVTLGNRLDADGVGTAVGVSEEFVVGGDGGTLATRVSARWATWKLVFAAHLPFATYKVPDGRTTGLGNLRLDAFHRIQKRDDVVMYGLSAHIPLGRAYTWTNSATGIWPGGGLTAVVQWRHATNSRVDLLARGALGVHGTAGFDPYPRVYLHASAAGGVDVPIRDVFGVTGEVAASVWDPSPFDASVWARVQPDEALEGFRGRVGVLLPLATWAGLSPSDKPAGVREMSFMLDIGLAL
ncbi:MAG: hypothetical protein H6737_32125 [Alphaproteobacteria bacterium]|nr:hypothetical protein [Alphaproteobacteria bacterium]